jgi:signal transduction histidine kinase
LPTTRRIIEEHGGHITVQSDAGKGTSFRVELPRAREA